MSPAWILAGLLNLLLIEKGSADDIFYPFDVQQGDERSYVLKGDDEFNEIRLNQPIKYGNDLYSTVYVSINGYVSFDPPAPQYQNLQFPFPLPLIAPLYSNVDTRVRGQVFAREINSEDLLQRSADAIRANYPNNLAEFQPKSLFIVTWDDVGYYNEGDDKGNSYQLVISTDGEESYAEFLYKENGIQWIQAESKNEETEIRGQAGFILPNGKLFALPGTGTDHVKTLDTKSNYGSPGRFMYRIGNIAEDRAELQEPVAAEEAPESEPTSCDDGGRATCDANADCNDKPSGFCCRCSPSFYGNGLACIQRSKKNFLVASNNEQFKAIPRRMVGTANVNINGIVQKDLNFQGYIVVQDGRVYAAVDQVSHRIGREMELISVLSGAPGWLFANPTEGAVNGFELTGGKLEHLTEMQFDPYHHLRIHQIFKGLDPQERLIVEVDISGKVPMLNPSTAVTIPDFAEEYTRVGPGEFRSKSKHIINFNDRERIEVSVDQTIKYKEHCPSEEDFPPQRLTVTKTFVSYNEHKEVIVRLASFYNISKSSDVTDPCILGKAQCIANSSCIVDGLSFKCVCNHGFQASNPEYDGNDLGCVDINECDDRSYFCHQNAICVNEIGSYSCHCNSGYTGDGRNCEPLQTELSPHMTCEDPNVRETCTCDNGYRIDFSQPSLTCVDIDECSENVCGESQECVNFVGGFECRCQFGFSLDDYGICQAEGCSKIRCPRGQRCTTDENGSPYCICDDGYTGNPPDCYPIGEYSTEDYNYDCRNCPPFSICIDNQCQCTYGYTGTPGRCTPMRENQDECESDRDCQPNAQCDYFSGTKLCHCSQGYVSNGNDCIASSTIIFARTCMNDECWCPPGFVYKGKYCVQGSANQIPSEDCTVQNNCHENAECHYIKEQDSHKCMCRPGYEGNGINCQPIPDISCFDADICHINATCVVDEGKPICICNHNFIGDGSVCYLNICSEDFYCETHSHCIYNREKEYQECVCDDGYEHQITNEKGQCVPIQSNPSCEECHPNATCTAYEQGGISCSCNDGFRGDGIRCEEEDRGCDVLGNCSPYADCIFNPEERGYRCECREGYEGDGLNCEEIVTCRTNYELCSEFASCEYIERNYVCKCQEGYFGNGTYCREASKQDEEFLLLAKGRAIIKLPLEPTQTPAGHPISVINQQNAIGIAIDCVEAKVYWSDVHGSKIYKSNYDGTEQESFVTDIRSPEGLAVDWIQRRLYWTDSGYHNISSADLDTKKIHDVITLKKKSNPRGITVHPWKRKVIWTDWIRENPRIEWANYDGTGREVLVNSPFVQLPNSLAIDWESDDLCWTDAGKKQIGCINLNAREPRIVIPNLVYPFGITITPQKFYWTDWNTKKVHMARKDNRGPVEQIDVPLGGHDRLTSIVAVSACPK